MASKTKRAIPAIGLALIFLVLSLGATGMSSANSAPTYYTANTNRSKSKKPSDSKPNSQQPPPGATAECRDNTYSFSTHRRGTCSHHGGVKRWLR